MAGIYYIATRCILCDSKKLVEALPLAPTPIADEYLTKHHLRNQKKYGLTLMLCKDCGHVQLKHIVSPKQIYIHYIFKTTSSPGLVNHFKEYAKDVLTKIGPPKDALLVEVGSNDGSLLKEFKKFGLRVLGVDPARSIAKEATREGIKTISNFFTPQVARTIKHTYGCASIVCANNVVANIDELKTFAESIKSLLTPDGVFVFESFYLKDLIQNKVFDFIFHEHMSYFSVTPLNAFFSKLGMQIIDVVHVPTKGGSLRYTVQLANGKRGISSSVNTYLTEEKDIGLQSLKLFRTFNKEITASKKDLQKILFTLSKRKKSIAGYGASATTTTLLYHFDLESFFPYLLDENPLKIGTFTPGFHIPVYDASELYRRSPDYVVILAWRFADKIIKQHATYIKNGGTFIVPLPKLRLVGNHER